MQTGCRLLISTMPMELQNAPQVALVCALTTNGERVYREAIDRLCARFGSIVDQSEPHALEEGGYYASEMGGELMKQLLLY